MEYVTKKDVEQAGALEPSANERASFEAVLGMAAKQMDEEVARLYGLRPSGMVLGQTLTTEIIPDKPLPPIVSDNCGGDFTQGQMVAKNDAGRLVHGSCRPLPETLTPNLLPLRVFDGEAMRAVALTKLRDKLGREPTAEDIDAAKAQERAEHPLRLVAFPSSALTPEQHETIRRTLEGMARDHLLVMPPGCEIEFITPGYVDTVEIDIGFTAPDRCGAPCPSGLRRADEPCELDKGHAGPHTVNITDANPIGSSWLDGYEEAERKRAEKDRSDAP